MLCGAAGCEEGPGICALIMTLGSLFLIVVSLPLSLMFVVKVVQEYERAVIFRLGRLLTGGARGPGVFFVIPCVDVYEKIDMRSQTFEIPPQEVNSTDYSSVAILHKYRRPENFVSFTKRCPESFH